MLASTCRALWKMDLPVVQVPGKEEGNVEETPERLAQGDGSALELSCFRQGLLTLVHRFANVKNHCR